MPDVNRDELLKTAAALKAAEDIRRYRAFEFYVPYEKQIIFHNAGGIFSERLLLAGNQLGKTLAGAEEAAFHMTGEYPNWWAGRRFKRPVRCWFGGETGVLVRDAMQFRLCGRPGVLDEFGTGTIPRDAFVGKPSLSKGVANAFDMIKVRHKSGGTSSAVFKTYEQGREKWQAESLDFIWYDEEPPEDIYMEGIARITATAGMVYVTFTPLKGLSSVVRLFLDEAGSDRMSVTMTIDDVGHISPEEKEKILRRYRPYEREARLRGVPMQGTGRIFQVTEEQVRCTPFQVPNHWVQLWALDFGIAHPFAAVKLAWDKDTDTLYVIHAIKMSDARPVEHAAAIKAAGPDIPIVWPQDGTARDKGSGKALSTIYKQQGLKMAHKHATFPDGSISTEAGVAEMDERMATNRFKVFSNLGQWFEEFRRYHRKDGLIVKEYDDLLSATRVGVMAKRFARTPHPHRPGQEVLMAKDIDFDPFS